MAMPSHAPHRALPLLADLLAGLVLVLGGGVLVALATLV